MPSLSALICPETPCHAASETMMLRIWKPCFLDSARRSSHRGSYSSYGDVSAIFKDTITPLPIRTDHGTFTFYHRQ